MTWLERAEAALTWAKTAGLVSLPVGMLLLAWVAFSQCQGRKAAEADRDRLAGEAQAAREGFEVQQQATAKQIAKAEADLIQANGAVQLSESGRKALAAELERLRKLHPGTQTTAVVSASTGATAANPAASASAAQGACLFAATDQGEIRLGTVTSKTKEGAKVLIGSAEAWRSGAQPTWLFGGVFSAPLTEAEEIAPPRVTGSGWGAGPLAGISTHGSQLGIAVATPEGRLPLLGGKVFVIAAGAGGSGEFTLSAAALWRP